MAASVLAGRVPARAPVPHRIQLAVVTVAVAALVAAPLSLDNSGTIHGLSAITAAVTLGALIVGAQRAPVQVGPRRRINVGTAPEVAAILLLPGPLAVLTLALGAMLGEAGTGARAVQRIFNVAVAALKALSGGLTMITLRDLWPNGVAQPFAYVAAAVAVYASTILLVRGMAAIQLRENPVRRGWAPPRELLIAEVVLSMTGILAALAAQQALWALVLIAGPAVVAQRALRAGIALEAQTRLALEDLADIVDLRDHYTFEHSRRVAELARLTARRLRLEPEVVELITMAGRMHDLGKIGVRSSVLMKPGPLTPTEWQEMRTHPEVGARLLGRFPAFARGQALVRAHHERFDGTGYPQGLRGEQIPLGARVIAVADAWDAITSPRAYRAAIDLDGARSVMRAGRGTQFDPVVLDGFLAVLDERPSLALAARAVAQAIDASPAPLPPTGALAGDIQAPREEAVASPHPRG